MKKIIYFAATWCGPCRGLSPIMDELAFRVNVQKVDVDNSKDEVHKYHVKSVPTLVLLEDGNETKRLVGSQTEKKIIEYFNLV